ncbi:MAG: carboxypeptidase-like regulatory domain-containing protein, partial [Crocinitomicaceae bacterium]
MVQKITRTFAFFASFMLVSIVSFAQNASVKGLVKDADGQALQNASVTVEGKSKGAMTSEKGFYEISGLSAGTYTLIYRFMGMETVKESIVLQENQSLIKDVTLQSKAKDENEVVVIGYGTSRTKDLTGSATVINEKNFVQGSLATPEQLIMGKVAGLKVTSNDGAPG